MKVSRIRFVSTLLLFSLSAQASGTPHPSRTYDLKSVPPLSARSVATEEVSADVHLLDSRRFETKLTDRILVNIGWLLENASGVEDVIKASAVYLRSLLQVHESSAKGTRERVSLLSELNDVVNVFYQEIFESMSCSGVEDNNEIVADELRKITDQSAQIPKTIIRIMSDFVMGDRRDFFNSDRDRTLNLDYFKTRLGLPLENLSRDTEELPNESQCLPVIVGNGTELATQRPLGTLCVPQDHLAVSVSNRVGVGPVRNWVAPEAPSNPVLLIPSLLVENLNFEDRLEVLTRSEDILGLYDLRVDQSKKFWKGCAGAAGGFSVAAVGAVFLIPTGGGTIPLLPAGGVPGWYQAKSAWKHYRAVRKVKKRIKEIRKKMAQSQVQS